MSDYPNARDCEHGSLRRSCVICELEAELDACRQERDEAGTAYIEQYDLANRLATRLVAAEQEVERLRAALPPAHRLRILADWIDRKYPHDSEPEIQDALRGWADAIDAALASLPSTVTTALRKEAAR